MPPCTRHSRPQTSRFRISSSCATRPGISSAVCISTSLRTARTRSHRSPSLLGKDALLDFSLEVSLDGECLSASEVRDLLKGADGLQLIRGRWVEVDQKKLGRLLKRFEAMGKAAQTGLPFNEGLRLLAGV